MSWTCVDLEKAAKNREFDAGQCNYAKDISLRSCQCVPLDWAPTVQQTPPCHFCDAGETVPNPAKEVDTGIIGTVDCGSKFDSFSWLVHDAPPPCIRTY